MRKLLASPMLTGLLAAQATPELVVSVGHAGAPSRAAFFDGYLATASWSNVAILDLATGLTVSHLPQGHHVMAVEASPAQDLLAVGTCGHSVLLWEVKSRALLRRLTLTQECVDALSFSPDGALLATGADGCCSTEKGLQVWDVRSGHLARELAPASAIKNVVFSGDGRWLAAVDDEGKANRFEWPSGRLLGEYLGLENPGSSDSALIASPDGKYLAWLAARELRVWDVISGDEVPLPGARTVHVRDISRDGERHRSRQQVWASAAEFLNDGRLAYITDDQLVLMRLPDESQHVLQLGNPETKWWADEGSIEAQSWLKIRRDGQLLAGTRGSGTVIWDVSRDRLRELSAPALASANSLRWSTTGMVAWADLESGVWGWDDRAGTPADLGRRVDSALGLAFRPDGARLAVVGLSSWHVLDVARRRSVASVDLSTAADTGVAFSPDGSLLALASSEGIAMFDGMLRPKGRFAQMEPFTSVEHVAFSPDGRWIAAGLGGAQPTLRVWTSLGSGTSVTLESDRVTYGPQPPAFSSDSQWLASFSRGRTLTIWATATWAVDRTWSLAGTGRALAFAPVGFRLAVAMDGEAAIWDADTGRKLVTFSAPGSSEATEIAWSPDGGRIVSSADDGVLRFWDASNGRLLASLFTLASSGDWLLVAPDGRIDGSKQALARVVAWRSGDRVFSDQQLTDRHRVRRLWRVLSQSTLSRE